MIYALILAAGKGVRFGSGEVPKQFCEIDGVPLVILSVQAYASLSEIDHLALVANPDRLEQTHELLQQFNLADQVTVVTGGATRQISVRNAAAAIGNELPGRDDVVILHNAVSPNTPAEFIRECLTALEGCDAVQACVPDTRTVFETDGEFVSAVLPRARLVYNCDPTVYRGDVFSAILAAQQSDGMQGETTSDTALQLGYKIRLVKSDYLNIKVTNPWDLEALRAAIRVRRG